MYTYAHVYAYMYMYTYILTFTKYTAKRVQRSVGPPNCYVASGKQLPFWTSPFLE